MAGGSGLSGGSRDPAPDAPAAPFAPRWTWRAWRAERRRRARHPLDGVLPTAVALGASVFCFVRVFTLLGGVGPGGAAPLGTGMAASMWLVLAVAALGLAGIAGDLSWMPKVTLRRGAPAAPLQLHDEAAVPRAPGVAPSAVVQAPRASTEDLVAVLERRPRPAAPPTAPPHDPGAYALARLFAQLDPA